MWALVPIKSLDRAKRRLSDTLTDGERRRLAEAMLEDVLRALLGALQVEGGAVISGDPAVREIARRYTFEALDEPSPPAPSTDPEATLNHALETARQRLEERAFAALLVIPGDVPLVNPGEIDELALRAAASRRAAVLAPDRWRRGTNALLLKPPDLLDFRFGPESAAAHRRGAETVEASFQEVDLPGLALDIDTAEDLGEVLTRPGWTLTHQVLSASGARGRPLLSASRQGAPP